MYKWLSQGYHHIQDSQTPGTLNHPEGLGEEERDQGKEDLIRLLLQGYRLNQDFQFLGPLKLSGRMGLKQEDQCKEDQDDLLSPQM